MKINNVIGASCHVHSSSVMMSTPLSLFKGIQNRKLVIMRFE